MDSWGIESNGRIGQCFTQHFQHEHGTLFGFLIEILLGQHFIMVYELLFFNIIQTPDLKPVTYYFLFNHIIKLIMVTEFMLIHPNRHFFFLSCQQWKAESFSQCRINPPPKHPLGRFLQVKLPGLEYQMVSKYLEQEGE